MAGGYPCRLTGRGCFQTFRHALQRINAPRRPAGTTVNVPASMASFLQDRVAPMVNGFGLRTDLLLA